jgi:hypothetical protein
MKTDRELLELAAKAAGYIETATVQNGFGFIALKVMDSDGDWLTGKWNPLTRDGDALRLAVKLKLDISFWSNEDVVVGDDDDIYECVSGDPYAATRRAIVRAAAEVGQGMLTHDEFVLMFPSRFEQEEVSRAAAAEIGETK